MKILQVVKTSDGAFWAVRQVSELIKQGVEVHVVLPKATGAALGAWQKTGALLHYLDCSLPVRSLWSIRRKTKKIRDLVEKITPDLIHSHSVTTTIMLRLALKGRYNIPRLFQVPGPLHLEQKYTRYFEILTAGKLDFWIASSRYTFDLYLAYGIPFERLFLSYYSTELTHFNHQKTGYLTKKLNIPADAFVVGNINLIYQPKKFLGHQVGLKCHEDVIEAISLAQAKNDNIWGVLIGGTFSGSPLYEKKLREMAEKKGNGKILMPGKFSAEEVGLCWPDFDCAVHVPLSENCGGVVEPMLCAVPTIAGQVGGLPEVVQHDITGITVPIQRPDLLADAILEVVNNQQKYQDMAERGRQLASNMFDPVRCTKEIHTIYEHVLNAQPEALEGRGEGKKEAWSQVSNSSI